MKPVNLLPEQHRRATAPGQGQGAYIVLGVLAALVLMAGLYALTVNKVNSNTSDANEAKHEAQELGARADSLGDFGDFARTEKNRSASVRALADVRFDWERFMRELSLVMPRRSWLTQVNSSVTGDLAASSAGSSSSGSSSSTSSTSTSSAGGEETTGQPKANLVGCSPKQTEVAKLMVRLRRLYRVTDVTLNKSARDAESGSASLDSCGRYLKFDVTLEFGATPASGEGPGEKKNVPTSLGGGS
jgi:Tfp pilus assembly protein PilN